MEGIEVGQIAIIKNDHFNILLNNAIDSAFNFTNNTINREHDLP